MKSILWFLLSLVFVHEAQGMGDYDKYSRQFYRDVEPHARPFFSQKMKDVTKQKIRDAFGGVSLSECESISQNAQRYRLLLKPNVDKVSLIREIAALPSAHRAHAIDALTIIAGGQPLEFSNGRSISYFGKELAAHDPLSSDDKSGLSLFMITPAGKTLSFDHKVNFVRNVIQTPVASRSNVLHLARFFLESVAEKDRSVDVSTHYWQTTHLSWMSILAAHGSEIDPESMSQAIEFGSTLPLSEKVQAWASFRLIAPSERPSVVQVLRELIPSLGRHWTIGKLITEVGALDVSSLKSFPSFVSSFFERDKYDFDALVALAQVDPTVRENITRDWRELRKSFHDDLVSYGVGYIASDFVALSLQERVLMLPLLKISLSSREYSGSSFMVDLKKMPPQERESLIIAMGPIVEQAGFRPVLDHQTYETHPFWDKEKRYPDRHEEGGFEATMKILMTIPPLDRLSITQNFARIIEATKRGIGDQGAENVLRKGCQILSSIDPEKRDFIVSSVLRLCEEKEESSVGGKLELSETLKSISDIEQVLETIGRLNNKWRIKNVYDLNVLLRNLQSLSLEAQARLIFLAEKVFPVPLQGYFCNQRKMFEVVKNLKTSNMEAFVLSLSLPFAIPMKSEILESLQDCLTIESNGSQGIRFNRDSEMTGLPSEEISRCEAQVESILEAIEAMIESSHITA
ncbi:MAG: hypothetical protein B7Y25_05400 [Alphaproteobacteria bacterium 16-39-46]|nr:MAG: hypothetical protein B7Y25_05400 [Alphaproteobacteria bacterium 16-39-46]OZA42664.1 MAG: hypothetical protein B7X84_05295 [Alphaproteobacteria bacterium 17-39-52]HQS84361.1 hypothetical protein [Alphaproteobacteria bacterium]HQS94193.1 hypothetical protein [Alphaproteobacteria bacterium]